MLIGVAWIGLWQCRLRHYWLCGAAPAEEDDWFPGEASFIIPARNEARHLPGLLDGLLAAGRPGTEIIVVDDGSTDATADRVRVAAGQDARVRLVACGRKPGDWAGKTWALAQGVEAARGEWLVFCDADVVPAAGLPALAWALVRQENLDCLSLIPRMENRRLSIALLLACCAVSRALLFRPATPGRPGLVQGAFLVVRRSVYEAVGGHKAVKASLLEDVDLGRNLQQAGYRVRARPAGPMLGTSMYESVRQTREGLKKHLFAALEFSSGRLFRIVVFHVLLFLVPFVSVPVAIAAAILGGATYWELATLGCAVLCFFIMNCIVLRLVREESLPAAAGLLVPLSLFGLGSVLVASAYGYRHGTITWKNRTYSAPGTQAAP